MKLVFMGTPRFAVPHLEALVETSHDVVAVVTRPDRPAGRGRKLSPPPVKEVATRLGIPVLQPAKLSDETFRRQVAEIGVDAICVVAYGGFLPRWLLELPPYGCINVHPSLLPRYRGAAPIQRAIMNNDEVTGVTTMYMVEAMDAGDIILQESIPIGPEDDAGTMHDRLAALGARLLCQTVDLIAEGAAPRVTQDESLVTIAPKITPEDEVIDWTQSAQRIDAQIRGLRPKPGAYTLHQGRRLKVWRTSPEPSDNPAARPGTVLAIGDDKITVAAGSGMLHVFEVQPENGKRLPARAYVNGYRMEVGERLGAE